MTMDSRSFAAAVALVAACPATPVLAQEGAKLFASQCKLCHAAASGPMGPQLTGVAGAAVAGRDDYQYSPALKAKGGVWSDDSLDAFLASPGRFAPGSRMPVSVAREEDRAALISYLKALK